MRKHTKVIAVFVVMMMGLSTTSVSSAVASDPVPVIANPAEAALARPYVVDPVNDPYAAAIHYAEDIRKSGAVRILGYKVVESDTPGVWAVSWAAEDNRSQMTVVLVGIQGTDDYFVGLGEASPEGENVLVSVGRISTPDLSNAQPLMTQASAPRNHELTEREVCEIFIGTLLSVVGQVVKGILAAIGLGFAGELFTDHICDIPVAMATFWGEGLSNFREQQYNENVIDFYVQVWSCLPAEGGCRPPASPYGPMQTGFHVVVSYSDGTDRVFNGGCNCEIWHPAWYIYTAHHPVPSLAKYSVHVRYQNQLTVGQMVSAGSATAVIRCTDTNYCT